MTTNSQTPILKVPGVLQVLDRLVHVVIVTWFCVGLACKLLSSIALACGDHVVRRRLSYQLWPGMRISCGQACVSSHAGIQRLPLYYH